MPVKDDISRLHHMLEAADDALVFINRKERADLDSDKMLVLALGRLLKVNDPATNCGATMCEVERCHPVTLDSTP